MESLKELLRRTTLLAMVLVFRPHLDYTPGPNPDTPAAGDFDGDGRSNLAVMIANQPLRRSLFTVMRQAILS
jgi:hypothetical protein